LRVNWWIAALAVTIPMAIGTTGSAQRAAPAIPVEAQKVALDTIVEGVHAIGTLRANQSIVVRPEIAGVVTRINFGDAKQVEKGSSLFNLDDSMDRAQLAQAEASLRLSQRNYERAQELMNRGSGTAQARDQASSALESDRAAVALARARLEKSSIRAPFSGVVGMSRIDLGAYVTAGQDLVTLDDVDTIKLDFTVPERHARFIALGQKVKVETDSRPGESFEGEIAVIDTRVDPASRALGVRAVIANPDHKLKPGVFVRAGVMVTARANAIVIPEQAIVPLGDKLLVYRVVNDKAAQTPIKIGLREFGRAEIVDGLKPDDVIVVSGQQKLQDGTSVIILSASGAPPSSMPSPPTAHSSGPTPANAAEPSRR